jgi:ABC-type transport system substrate-binding protein
MGAGNPAFFGSQSAAVAWEKKVAPSNDSISSVTTRGSETGGGGGNTFNINVTGGGNAEETAEMVAQEIVAAIQRSGYNELYTS